MPTALAPGVYWVGAVDWNIRGFHGYSLPEGTTYNAYLVVDEKVALIDTVKPAFFDEMLYRIKEVLDPKDIDFVIANHMEMDHSGSLPQILSLAPKAKLITSEKFGEESFKLTFHPPQLPTPVKEGSEISLGKRKLRFFPIPMLHWPDSMATYLVEEGILFPNDAFGQHIATSQRFDDEVNLELVMREAAAYYATILMPYSSLIPKALEKLGSLNIKIIAPSHGIIWRSYIPRIINAYSSWSRGETKTKVVVIYDTMWGSTEKMAQALVEGITGEGVEARMINLSASDRTIQDLTEAIYQILDARAILIGSPTVNNGMLATVAGFLNTLKGLKPRGKIGAAFGSYGWGGGAVKEIEQALKEIGMEMISPGLDFKFVPDEDGIDKCRQFGRIVARRVSGK